MLYTNVQRTKLIFQLKQIDKVAPRRNSKMGSKVKQRDVANQRASQATLSVNERILKECHNLYTEADNGLIEVSHTTLILRMVFIDHDQRLTIDRLVKGLPH